MHSPLHRSQTTARRGDVNARRNRQAGRNCRAASVPALAAARLCGPVGAVLAALCCAGAALADETTPLSFGAERELMVDDRLIAQLRNAELRLQTPVPREVVLVHDAPWEGNVSTYHTVFQDGPLYRMYYRGGHYDEQTRKMVGPETICYAESRDGIHWEKPELGLHEYDGSTKNNIVLMGTGSHNLAPFKDAHPACPPESRYKAVASGNGGLMAFRSADGLRWEPLRPEPIITDGAFDSLNLAFWDVARQRYVAFFRDFRDGVRDVKTCTSADFLHWSEPQWLAYEGAPQQHLYTNAIVAYDRAPHLFVGLPKRFAPDRNPARHPAEGVSDCGFMTSRDGLHFHRWNAALVRPGTHPDNWVNRNNLAAWGIVTTACDVPGGPPELSIYTTEGYYRGPAVRLRRHTLRLDGFASVSADADRGEMLTRTLALADGLVDPALMINFACSAFGSVRCEVQTPAGQPIPGFELEQCAPLYGDQIEMPLVWNSAASFGQLAGQPFRLRFVLEDADLFAFRCAAPASVAP